MANWTFKTRTVQPIGLDIGHNSVKMIQLAVDDSGITVLAARKAHIDPIAVDNCEERRRVIVMTIKQMLSEGAFTGRNVVSALPNEKVKITSLRLADTETSQIEQIVKKEAAQRFALDPDKDIVRYVYVGAVRQGDETKNELILFVTDDQTIKTHIALLEDAGLKPVGLDVVPCALFRSFERQMRRQEDKERTVIFVDVGHLTTTVVFGRAAELCFVKQIPIAGDNFNREVASKLGLNLSDAEALCIKFQKEDIITPPAVSQSSVASDEESGDQILQGQRQNAVSFDPVTRQIIVDAISRVCEELAKEISLCLRYYSVTFRGKRIERAVITGGGAYEDILLDILKRILGVEIEIAEPLRGFTMAEMDLERYKREPACEWAVAVGLSLKGLDRPLNKTRQAQEQIIPV